jgi:hypothetical protein
MRVPFSNLWKSSWEEQGFYWREGKKKSVWGWLWWEKEGGI